MHQVSMRWESGDNLWIHGSLLLQSCRYRKWAVNYMYLQLEFTWYPGTAVLIHHSPQAVFDDEGWWCYC